MNTIYASVFFDKLLANSNPKGKFSNTVDSTLEEIVDIQVTGYYTKVFEIKESQTSIPESHVIKCDTVCVFPIWPDAPPPSCGWFGS